MKKAGTKSHKNQPKRKQKYWLSIDCHHSQGVCQCWQSREKNPDFLFASSYQLKIAFWLRVRHCVHFSLSMIIWHLVWTCVGLFGCCHIICEFICISVLLPRRYKFLGVIKKMRLLQSFWFLVCIHPWALMGGLW